MMIKEVKEASLQGDPDLRGELAFLARGCDFVLPSRFKKRLKSFQQQQVSGFNSRDRRCTSVEEKGHGCWLFILSIRHVKHTHNGALKTFRYSSCVLLHLDTQSYIPWTATYFETGIKGIFIEQGVAGIE
ncbi:hypothetical protein XENOCAPTIV_001482 [Xenoophorus captivus]|uniref:Uncharacterized protein n=1 Tax=Xenoophorus captivus TaxID=1517983 RepID=A0ABV0RN38_9TELE